MDLFGWDNEKITPKLMPWKQSRDIYPTYKKLVEFSDVVRVTLHKKEPNDVNKKSALDYYYENYQEPYKDPNTGKVKSFFERGSGFIDTVLYQLQEYAIIYFDYIEVSSDAFGPIRKKIVKFTQLGLRFARNQIDDITKECFFRVFMTMKQKDVKLYQNLFLLKAVHGLKYLTQKDSYFATTMTSSIRDYSTFNKNIHIYRSACELSENKRNTKQKEKYDYAEEMHKDVSIRKGNWLQSMYKLGYLIKEDDKYYLNKENVLYHLFERMAREYNSDSNIIEPPEKRGIVLGARGTKINEEIQDEILRIPKALKRNKDFKQIIIAYSYGTNTEREVLTKQLLEKYGITVKDISKERESDVRCGNADLLLISHVLEKCWLIDIKRTAYNFEINDYRAMEAYYDISTNTKKRHNIDEYELVGMGFIAHEFSKQIQWKLENFSKKINKSVFAIKITDLCLILNKNTDSDDFLAMLSQTGIIK